MKIIFLKHVFDNLTKTDFDKINIEIFKKNCLTTLEILDVYFIQNVKIVNTKLLKIVRVTYSS